MVRVAAVENVSGQEPEGAAPVQLSPVLAFTVTVPEGVSVSPVGGATKKLTVTAWSTSAGFGETEVIVVVVPACTPVPLSVTCCVDPSTSSESSVNVRVPVNAPTRPAAKATNSVQVAVGASGEAVTQF
jgi:hypothetical protein